MRARYYTIVVLLIVSHLLTELHTFIMWLNPKSVTSYVGDWFLKPRFKIESLSILWYFKMVEDSLLLTSIIFAGACQAFSKNYETYLKWQRYSFRLYLIWVIYFAYHCFDLAMFIYNYKTSYWLYVTVLTIITLAAVGVGFVHRRTKSYI